ncbi:FYVE and coiled-coil domain-containing protein 1 [Paramormyrops kingsleyae]
MATVTVGENQLQRIIRDLQDAVIELKREHNELGEPITDDSVSLHKFSYKLEYLLQFDQKEKKTLLGTRKDYWDYFSDCLGKIKGANDGIRYVKSIPELKTSLGKGRAFIRYSLFHQRLADTLQQCLMNQRVTSDWYYARSPFLKSHLAAGIINHLYELNEVQFDVASRGFDLDSSWPTFARRTLGSPAHMWRPPSRSSSISSLVSSYSQAPEFVCSPEPGPSFISDLSSLTPCSAAEDLRVELDQSELRQQELLEQVERANEEAAGLRALVKSLESQLEARHRSANQKNDELLARLDAALVEMGQHAVGHLDYAQKIHVLLDKLKEAEKAKFEALREAETRRQEADGLAEDLRRDEASGCEMEEMHSTIEKLQGALAVKEKESRKLQMQLLDLQSSLEARDRHVEELKWKLQEEKGNLNVRQGSDWNELEGQLHALTKQLGAEKEELSVSPEMETQEQSVSTGLVESEADVQQQRGKVDDYKARCACLMELNDRMLQIMSRNKETKRELTEVQEAHMGGQAADTMVQGVIRRLQLENRELGEKQGILTEALSSTREELRAIGCHITELESSLTSSRRSEATFREQLKGAGLLESRDQQSEELQAGLQSTERGPSALALQAQLELHVKEVSRLQTEAVDLRCRVQDLAKEKLKAQAQLEVAEASCEELKSLTDQLKSQVEELNRRHVQEILLHQQREEMLETEEEAHSLESASCREELDVLKQRLERLALEHAETKAYLEKATTETAELGIRVGGLTSEKEEAYGRLQVLEQENTSLHKRLQQAEALSGTVPQLQERLKQAEVRAREEVDTVRFQMSGEALTLQNQLQCASGELESVRQWHAVELEKTRGLEARLSQLEDEIGRYSQLLEERNVLVEKSESVIQQKGAEMVRLTENLTSAEEELSATQAACRDLREQMDLAAADRRSCDMKTAAEIDDLYRTKKNLEERLIELIQDKDALFKQNLRSEEPNDRDGTHCLGCQGQFSWWLRRHPCRLCARPFCYYCSNSATRMLPSGKRDRCCRDCGAAPGRTSDPDVGSPPNTPSSHSSPYRPTPIGAATPQSPKVDDGVFDIISEEEVNEVHDGDSFSQVMEGSPERTPGTLQPRALDLSNSVGDMTLDDTDELTPVVQDAEIYLLKSGELTLLVPLSLEDVACFGETSRELFIKSSCYSSIAITAPEAGPTIAWVFSSEPKSISFSVVHRPAADSPLEQNKVLIPLTRCNSHKETIHGQLKVRNPGIYTFIFDNSFSRFISKKVLYHLIVEKPVKHNGSEPS